MTPVEQAFAVTAETDPRLRIIARLRKHKQVLLVNGWIVRKQIGSKSYYVVRWRERIPGGKTVQRSCYLTTDRKLAEGAKRLLVRWRKNAGLVPSEKTRLGLELLKKYGDTLQLHYRAHRRLGRLCRRIRVTNDEQLVFAILRDDDGMWLEHLLWGESWELRERREGLPL